MDAHALLKREEKHYRACSVGTFAGRGGLVEYIQRIVGHWYWEEEGINWGFYDVLWKTVACLDRIMSESGIEELVQRGLVFRRKDGSGLISPVFPASCFLLVSKCIKSQHPAISCLAEVCKVDAKDLARAEVNVLIQSKMNLFNVTTNDYLMALAADIPEDRMVGVTEKLVKSLFKVPYTSIPPSVVAAAVLHASLPAECLRLDADTGLARFLVSMVGRREEVLRLAEALK